MKNRFPESLLVLLVLVDLGHFGYMKNSFPESLLICASCHKLLVNLAHMSSRLRSFWVHIGHDLATLIGHDFARLLILVSLCHDLDN